MNPMDKKQLIDKFLQSTCSPEEELLLERLIEEGKIDLQEIQPLHELHEQLDFLSESPEPPAKLSFDSPSPQQAAKDETPEGGPRHFPQWIVLAGGVACLLIGSLVGWFLKPAPQAPQELNQLKEEVIAMKELMMLNMLEKSSSSERLKAVSLSRDLEQSSQKVSSALLQTLRQDENSNVRLAALEALYAYANQAEIRIELVKSIQFQESPLVLMAMAEMMAALQEKRSAKAWKDILRKQELPEELRQQLKGKLEVLL
ncbi:MAG: hypothetical protein AAFV25_19610 [Bacteroidota bacterium]